MVGTAGQSHSSQQNLISSCEQVFALVFLEDVAVSGQGSSPSLDYVEAEFTLQPTVTFPSVTAQFNFQSPVTRGSTACPGQRIPEAPCGAFAIHGSFMMDSQG